MQQKHLAGKVRKTSVEYSFRAFSFHFDMPLKAAAEKFGVRATAFKKRCRAIGIRHWPYRKVRSLKRSIEELVTFQENGAITDKQRQQLVSFEGQLEMLLAPQTYGILSNNTMIRFDDVTCFDGSPSPKSSPKSELSPLKRRLDSPMRSITNCNSISPSSTDKQNHFRLPSLQNCHGRLTTLMQQDSIGEEDDFEMSKDSLKISSPMHSLDHGNLFATTFSDIRASRTSAETDHFQEALEHMEYSSDKHFLDDFLIELSPLYDCKV